MYPVKSPSYGAFTEGTTTEGMVHSEIYIDDQIERVNIDLLE